MEPTSTAELSFTIRARDLRASAASSAVGHTAVGAARGPSSAVGHTAVGAGGGPSSAVGHTAFGAGGGLSSAAGMQRRPWLARLRSALREDRFVLHYQPIVSLRDGRIAGARPTHYEALIRLAGEPGGALTAPAAFLPAAERHGLIGEIDRRVLTKVVGLLGRGLAGCDTRIAVNLSALSITDPRMLSYVERLLELHGVVAERLIVEVTETSAISDMARARAFCAGLRSLGVAVALDDFGAGFGSLQYLKHLPFDFLKIDGEFVRSLLHSHSDRLLVQALVSVARGMGKRTIAEYVGDRETVSLLRELGVDYAQGFELGRPVCPVEAFSIAS